MTWVNQLTSKTLRREKLKEVEVVGGGFSIFAVSQRPTEATTRQAVDSPTMGSEIAVKGERERTEAWRGGVVVVVMVIGWGVGGKPCNR